MRRYDKLTMLYVVLGNKHKLSKLLMFLSSAKDSRFAALQFQAALLLGETGTLIRLLTTAEATKGIIF